MSEIKKTNIILFSGDYDKAMAAFIIANGAATYEHEVTIFATFWGINALRKDSPIKVKKGFIEKMFGKMMPRGADKLGLSKMNYAGIGDRKSTRLNSSHVAN